MAWLLREGDVLAAFEDQIGSSSRPFTGTVLKRSPVFVHTLRRNTPVELAWCMDGRTDGGEPCLVVRRICCLPPRRVGRPQWRRGAVVMAERGAFERWNLKVGDRLEIRDT
jgi:hypothetical protein